MSNVFKIIRLAVLMVILTAISSTAVEWESLGFIKCMSHDPNHYNLSSGEHLPVLQATYDTLDAMGINVICAALGTNRYEVLSTDKNYWRIPLMVSTSVYHYTARTGDPSIGALTKAVAFKKPAAKWEDRIGINDTPGYERAEKEFYINHFIIRANPYEFGSGIVAYTNSAMSLDTGHPDYDQHKRYFVNPGKRWWYFAEKSPCFIQIQAWTNWQYEGLDPILKIRLWEVDGGGAEWEKLYYFVGELPGSPTEDTYFRITDQPYTWHNLIELDDDPGSEVGKMHKDKKIQIEFESLGETNINIFIDSIAVYDLINYNNLDNH